MPVIPIDHLPEQAALRLDVMPFAWVGKPLAETLTGIHRDDHYVFLLCEQGTAELRVDFEHLCFHGGSSTTFCPRKCMSGWGMPAPRAGT